MYSKYAALCVLWKMQSTVALSIASAPTDMQRKGEDKVDGRRTSVAREVREDSVIDDDSNSDSSNEDTIPLQNFLAANYEEDEEEEDYDPDFNPDMDVDEDSESDSESPVAPRKRTTKKTAAPVRKQLTRAASKR